MPRAIIEAAAWEINASVDGANLADDLSDLLQNLHNFHLLSLLGWPYYAIYL
jgi:hypothetical protein